MGQGLKQNPYMVPNIIIAPGIAILAELLLNYARLLAEIIRGHGGSFGHNYMIISIIFFVLIFNVGFILGASWNNIFLKEKMNTKSEKEIAEWMMTNKNN